MPIITRIRKMFKMDKQGGKPNPGFIDSLGLYQADLHQHKYKPPKYGIAGDGCLINENPGHVHSINVLHHSGPAH